MCLQNVFGITPTGEKVDRIILTNNGLTCSILTYGATLQTLYVPDKDGVLRDVVLGYDTLEEYLHHDGYLGAVVGRYANRIAKGRFCLNGKQYVLACNDGENHLHGGNVGFSMRIWKVAALSENSVSLSLKSWDGEEGYPGKFDVTVTYILTAKGLQIHYEAESNQDTLCNLTNHAYFNLAGHDSGTVLNHSLKLAADYYTPTDDESIPTGECASVKGTPMDFTEAMRIGSRIEEDFNQLKLAGGYDHNYILDTGDNTLHAAAELCSKQSGIGMVVSTTLPGIQLYTANYLTDHRKGKGGVVYNKHQGVCLETQVFPDSPNKTQFPSAVLYKDEKYSSTTEYMFWKK